MPTYKRFQLRGGECTSDQCALCLDQVDSERPYIQIPVSMPNDKNLYHCFHAGELRRLVVIALNTAREPLNPLTRASLPDDLVDRLISDPNAISDEERYYREDALQPDNHNPDIIPIPEGQGFGAYFDELEDRLIGEGLLNNDTQWAFDMVVNEALNTNENLLINENLFIDRFRELL